LPERFLGSENNIEAATGKLYDMPLAAKADF